MTPKKKKILIIAVPIIAVVIICLVILALYLMTDFLKSNKTLFLKYMSQNIDTFKIATDNTSEKEYTNILKQNSYEAKKELQASYTEKHNTTEENKNNDINKIKMTVDEQSQYFNGYNYQDIQILFNNKDIFKAEYIHDNDKYGIRFPERYSQFLSVENHDLKQVASNIGLNEEQVELIPDSIEEFDFNSLFTFTDEEYKSLQEKYAKILSDNISNDKYSKQKNALITVNEQSLYTTAYSVTLTEEQINNVYIKLLEQLKDDEIILNNISQFESFGIAVNSIKNDEFYTNNNYLREKYISYIEKTIDNIMQNNIGTSQVKYTVYVSKGNTIRTQLQEEKRQITIDYNVNNNDIEINIQDKEANEEKDIENDIKISKKYSDGQSALTIEYKNIVGETEKNFEFYRNKSINESNVTAETGLKYDDGKENFLEVTLTNNAELNGEQIEKIELNDSNNVILNNYEKEIVTQWINHVNGYLKTKREENKNIITNISKIETIGNIFGQPKEEVIIQNETTEVDKNRFNAKFEFYTGKEKKSDEVVKLIEETKDCLKNAQVSYSNVENSTADNKTLQSIKLELQDKTPNKELADSVKDYIEENKTYTVEVQKNSSNIIERIIITVNK